MRGPHTSGRPQDDEALSLESSEVIRIIDEGAVHVQRNGSESVIFAPAEGLSARPVGRGARGSPADAVRPRTLRSRPAAVGHRRRRQLLRIDDNVPDALTLPRVGDVNASVATLYDGR